MVTILKKVDVTIVFVFYLIIFSSDSFNCWFFSEHTQLKMSCKKLTYLSEVVFATIYLQKLHYKIETLVNWNLL